MNIKGVPKKAAKVVVGEAFETLKKAKEQVTATGEYAQKGEDKPPEDVKKEETDSRQKKAKEVRRFQAYQAELKDISTQTVKEKEAKKREESIQSNLQETPKEPAPQISSVPSRGRGKFFGLKKKLSELGKTVELRKPPSG